MMRHGRNLPPSGERGSQYNNEGRDPGSFLGRGYPYGQSAYFSYIDTWRASDTFDGLEFK
jgi:hypothetical protein